MQKTMILVIGAAFVLLGAGCVRDESDPPEGRMSGMAVRTDNLTGCQYLRAGHGITPRMGADGKQICRVKP